jgi:hypothetical protein
MRGNGLLVFFVYNWSRYRPELPALALRSGEAVPNGRDSDLTTFRCHVCQLVYDLAKPCFGDGESDACGSTLLRSLYHVQTNVRWRWQHDSDISGYDHGSLHFGTSLRVLSTFMQESICAWHV